MTTEKKRHCEAKPKQSRAAGKFWIASSLAFLAMTFLFMSAAAAQSHACHGPPDCATPGSVCPDGTVYAGCAGDKYYPFFVTRCDAGQAWTGSCTGTRVTKPWNNANSSGYVTTSQTGLGNGKANTIALSTGGTYGDSDSVTAGIQPHQAAQYCTDLVQDGHDDWYLPAISELYTMYVHSTAIGNFIASIFWSSSEYSNSLARYQNFSGGSQSYTFKFNFIIYVRCARRN